MPLSKLVLLLRNAEAASGLPDAAWNSIIPLARQMQLLGQLACALKHASVISEISPAVRRHIALAELVSTRRTEAAMAEIAVIRQSIDPAIPIILLKGCAYAMANDPNACGRLFSDIDILVPKASLPRAEASLIGGGWKPDPVDAYDEHYYRQWMHELPPMTHVRRQTSVDLHHAIVPPISRFSFRIEELTARAQQIDSGIFVLAPVDRIIHCAAHLILEGETTRLLRNLYDLHLLLAHHCADSAKLRDLKTRASELGLERLLAAAAGAASRVFSGGSLHAGKSWLENCLVRAALRSNEGIGVLDQAVDGILLSYSHWAKMPIHILFPHLIRKSLMRLKSGDSVEQSE